MLILFMDFMAFHIKLDCSLSAVTALALYFLTRTTIVSRGGNENLSSVLNLYKKKKIGLLHKMEAD